ncbi:condensation domain-containing protein [Nakamurella sp.]|uniref:condensation domain-containing protein n=1 Tax=Nakamurella sp. TaxID=1869182 RepID=UPI003B3BD597
MDTGFRAATGAGPGPVTGDPAPALRPISVGQQALWTLHRLAPDSAAYNDAGAARLTGAVDVSALAGAVDDVTRRHDLLRSRFVDDDGWPGRVVDPAGPRLEVVDVGPVDDAVLAALVAAAAGEPYDLETGTARFRLFRRAPDDAVLLSGNHHIASDAASQFVLWRDLLAAYRARSAGAVPELPRVAWSWDDQVAAERRALAGPHRAGWSEHWRATGRDAPAGELATDRPRPRHPAYRGGTVTVPVPPALHDRVQERAVALGVTPFAVHLAALQTSIHRSGGQRRFLVGCPMSLRRRRETLPAVGYYVNMVLLRAEIDPSGPTAGLVRAAARELRAAAGACGLPYPHIVRALDRGRDAGPPYRIAITQVDARIGPAADRAGSEAGGRIEAFAVPRLQGQYDLGVEVTRTVDGSAVAFRYDRELFDEATIHRHLGTYLQILDRIGDDPGVRPCPVGPE